MKVFISILLISISLFAMAKKQNQNDQNSSYQQVDDWEYNQTIQSNMLRQKGTRAMPMVATMAAPMMKMSSDSLGLSVGGAKDSNNFYENIKNGYIPKIDSITYEGVFYDHYFQTSKGEACKELFCPKYKTVIRNNPYNGEKDYYLSVGLNSNLTKESFKRKQLNIVVVLDISGSMNSPFNRYYYDKFHNKKENSDNEHKIKMEIANNSLVDMIDHLYPDDRLGIVLFDNHAYDAKPLRVIKKTDIKATKKHILELRPKGGTNWSAGYKRGVSFFDKLDSKLKNPNLYENRIIFLTDAMPNSGELRDDGLFGMVDNASKKGIYTTFIGIGVDFNNNLVERVSKTKGANYYSVHSQKEFKKRLDEEFDYMVTPLVFDLKLSLNGDKIEAVYGSPEANMATGDVMYVNTLFPSPSQDGATKGGIILIKVKDTKDLKLSVSYKNREGESFKVSKDVKFINSNDKATKKAIQLADYVTIAKNWILDSRAGCNDKVEHYSDIIAIQKKCMIYPPNRPIYQKIKTWERKSCSLKVSDGYKKLFSLFLQHFKGDDYIKEIETIKELISYSSTSQNEIIDDWNTRR